MQLKPQDILFLLKLVAHGKKPWTFSVLAIELGMSPSEIHAAAQRCLAAGLAVKGEQQVQPNIRSLAEFLEHGLRYVFVPDRGPLERGLPTAVAAAPLNAHFPPTGEPLPVWPDPAGTVRGEAFSPLYKSAPHAARLDHQLYALLALVDAIRGGRARERQLAIKELKELLANYGKVTES
jgi:hypothetical protein